MASSNIGIADNARRATALALTDVLADTFALYVKTHAYHWNIIGPEFATLHELFGAQYQEMWTALDAIAERVRALGEFAPHSAARLEEGSAIEPAAQPSPKAADMVRDLLDGHEALIRRARKALAAAGEAGDAASEDLLTERIAAHEKTAWMLRAIAS
jgi:starvation-inducible DNA-binding protein